MALPSGSSSTNRPLSILKDSNGKAIGLLETSSLNVSAINVTNITVNNGINVSSASVSSLSFNELITGGSPGVSSVTLDMATVATLTFINGVLTTWTLVE